MLLRQRDKATLQEAYINKTINKIASKSLKTPHILNQLSILYNVRHSSSYARCGLNYVDGVQVTRSLSEFLAVNKMGLYLG